MKETGITIPWARPLFLGNEEQYLLDAFRSTWISGGAYVDRFEHDFGSYVDSPFALTSSNGTTAMHMAYLALGIGVGDEVVVPGFAFMAGANIALHMGATPVFAEVDPRTWCMRAEDVEKCLTPRTRLIVAVHTYGNVCAMDDLISLSDVKGIPVLEDTAEAFMSRHRGRAAGSMGTVGAYSFQATKGITTGEGGMAVTRSRELYEAMWLYRNHGMKATRYWHELAGHNFRMTNLQAAVGCAQLEKVETIIGMRKRVHELYTGLLSDMGGVVCQRFEPEVDPVLWSCAVKLDGRAFPQGRDRLMEQMAEAGIETRPGFYAASLMELYKTPALPVCEDISRQVVSLPTYPSLGHDQIEYVCATLSACRK